MKTRIFSLILVVLMLASAVMMTGCSYSFRGEDYSEELGEILTLDSYKDLAVEVSVTKEQDEFLDAYYAKENGDATALNEYVDEKIAESMRKLYYTDTNNKKVYFTGTPKLGAATKNDDVKVYYYVTASNGTGGLEVYTNLGSTAGAYQLGAGSLIGVNFDTALLDKGITAGMGSLDRISTKEEKKITGALIEEGYNVLYVTMKATYTVDEAGKNYEGHKGDTTYRFDLSLIDMQNKTLKADCADDYGHMTQYKDYFIEAVLSACDFDTGVELAADNEYKKTVSIDDTNDNTDNGVDREVTFTAVVKEAQMETFGDSVTFVFEASNTKVPLLNGQEATVQFIVESVNEYSLSADLTEYMTLAKIEQFLTLVQKIDSSFTTDKTEKADIVSAYKEHYIKTTNDTINNSIKAEAKELMLTLIIDKATASFKDENYPNRAVKDTYNEKVNNYKYAYKSLSDTDATQYASLEEYIIAKEDAADYADAEASMLADSKRIVLEKMIVIHTANLYGIEVTRDDYNAKREEIINSMYIYLMLGMSEDDIIDQAGGKDGIYLAIYYTRAMERVYEDNKDNVTVTVES